MADKDDTALHVSDREEHENLKGRELLLVFLQ